MQGTHSNFPIHFLSNTLRKMHDFCVNAIPVDLKYSNLYKVVKCSSPFSKLACQLKSCVNMKFKEIVALSVCFVVETR